MYYKYAKSINRLYKFYTPLNWGLILGLWKEVFLWIRTDILRYYITNNDLNHFTKISSYYEPCGMKGGCCFTPFKFYWWFLRSRYETLTESFNRLVSRCESSVTNQIRYNEALTEFDEWVKGITTKKDSITSLETLRQRQEALTVSIYTYLLVKYDGYTPVLVEGVEW